MSVYTSGSPTTPELPTILWNNKFLTGTLSFSTETAVTGIAANAITESTFDFWRPTAVTATLTIDMGSATTWDSAALVAHNCGTKGNTVNFRTSPDNITYTTRCTAAPAAGDDTTILMIFSSVSFRYARFEFVGGSVPDVGVAMAGDRLILPGGVKPPYIPVWQSQKTEVLVSESMGGQFLGNRLIRQGLETQINLVSFTSSFVDTSLLAFRKHFNSGKAFVFASSPSFFPKDTGYLWRKENADMRPVFDENGSWMSVGMDVYGYADS